MYSQFRANHGEPVGGHLNHQGGLENGETECGRVKGVMLDLTGVLVQMGKSGAFPLPGSVQAVHRLKSCGVQVRCVSNCTQGHRSLIESTLLKMGFPLDPHDIFTPIPIITQILHDNSLRPFLLVHKDSAPDFHGIHTDDPNCVVIGDAQDNFTYENMNRAFRILISSPEARLFALGSGKYYKLSEGLSLDVGSYVKSLEFASGVRSEVVGKPSPDFFRAALRDMNISASEAVMVGDDYETDMMGAASAGVRGILVRTGKPPPANLPSSQRVEDNIDAAVDSIIAFNQAIDRE